MKRPIFLWTGIAIVAFIVAFQNQGLTKTMKRVFDQGKIEIEKGAIMVYQEIKSVVNAFDSALKKNS